MLDINKGVLPDRAIFPYTALPYQRLADELTKRNSYLFTLATNGIPILPYIDRESAASKINPAWIFVRVQGEQSGWTISRADADKLSKTPKIWVEKWPTKRDANGNVTESVTRTFNGTALEYKLRWLLGYGALEGGYYMQNFAGWENQLRFAIRGTANLVEWAKKKAASNAPQLIDCQKWNPPTGCKNIVPKTLADRAALRYTPRTEALYATGKLYLQWFPEYLST